MPFCFDLPGHVNRVINAYTIKKFTRVRSIRKLPGNHTIFYLSDNANRLVNAYSNWFGLLGLSASATARVKKCNRVNCTFLF